MCNQTVYCNYSITYIWYALYHINILYNMFVIYNVVFIILYTTGSQRCPRRFTLNQDCLKEFERIGTHRHIRKLATGNSRRVEPSTCR